MGASESKLAFKEDIFRLAGEENIPIDSQWWSRFLQLPETAEDVQTLWSPNDLRSLTFNTPTDRPRSPTQTAPKKNAETLIYRTISRLHALQTKRVFPDPNTPIAPEILNGVRILTRFLPYIYEAEHLHDWEDKFFWQPRKPVCYADSKTHEPKYFDGLDETKTVSEEDKDKDICPPLGEQLVDILMNYLFFPNFTLPARKDANEMPELKPIFVVWSSGIGANKGVGMTKQHESNAMEVLRLLLVLSSKALYMSPNVAAETDNRPLTYLTTQSDRVVVLNTICSLLNTIYNMEHATISRLKVASRMILSLEQVLKYNQNPWTFPLDLGAATKDTKQPLVTYSLQILLVLITYPVPNDGANEFRKALGRLHRAEDFQFIGEGLRQILMQPTSGMFKPVQRLTSSVAPIAPETLALFWELLQCNKRFRSYLIDTDRARDFVVLVLYYAVEAKDDPSKQGIVRMCVFILQTLSVEEKFGRKLNSPFTFQETLPSALQIPNFHGSYADFLIGHIHTLLTSSNRSLESLHPALLAIINNNAPYVQELQRATSSMLMNIFVSMSQPTFLLANESNHVLLSSLLDAMNAILEHQYEENRRFVDAVIKGRKRFEVLRDFTVDGALEEVDRIARERKDAGELAGATSLRNASLDSARGARSAALRNVPEDSAFAIGEDEDEEDEGEDGADDRTPRNESGAAVDNAVLMQARNMSEKARGKQPVNSTSFSRSTSRTTSNASLNAYSTVQQQSHTTPQPFAPTPEWLHTFLPHLPLHTILQIVENVGGKTDAASQRPNPASDNTNDATTASPSPSQHSHHLKREPTIKVQGFHWTSLSLGWYMSVLWGWVYASDTARIWVGTNVRLFNVRSQKSEISLRSPRGAVDAVGDTIARRIGNLSFNSNSQTSMREV